MERFRTLERLLSSRESREEDVKKSSEEAIGSFKKSLELYPAHREPALQIARVCFERKDPVEARRWCTRAAELSPDLATACLLRALIDLERYENLRHQSGGELRPVGDEARRLAAQIEEDLRRV